MALLLLIVQKGNEGPVENEQIATIGDDFLFLLTDQSNSHHPLLGRKKSTGNVGEESDSSIVRDNLGQKKNRGGGNEVTNTQLDGDLAT